MFIVSIIFFPAYHFTVVSQRETLKKMGNLWNLEVTMICPHWQVVEMKPSGEYCLCLRYVHKCKLISYMLFMISISKLIIPKKSPKST